jgi:hypothetical protein
LADIHTFLDKPTVTKKPYGEEVLVNQGCYGINLAALISSLTIRGQNQQWENQSSFNRSMAITNL